MPAFFIFLQQCSCDRAQAICFFFKILKPILKKVNEGDEKKQAKKPSWKKYFLSLEMGLIFFGNRQQFNARAGQKKTHVFFGNARPKSNARTSKTEKNIVASSISQRN